MDYASFFQSSLDVIRQDGRYRTFVTLERLCGEAPYALWHKEGGARQRVVVCCSNDYLGMSEHPDVIHAFKQGIDQYGAGSGGTRNISGTSDAHVALEKDIAELHQKEAGLLFSSGYTANKATLSLLGRTLPGCVIFSDEKNHASMIHGIRYSGATRHVFSHNNLQELEEQLKCYPLEQAKIIAFVSVYSMDGDFAPIKEIIALAKKYNALTFLDEVHAVGLYGEGGAGLANAWGVQKDIDIFQGNFAKGYGVVGGYIASSAHLVDYVRSFASGFIFTTSLPPALANACRASMRVQREQNDDRKKLFGLVSHLKSELRKTPVKMIENDSHIVPVRVGNAQLCKALCDRLLAEYAIYLQPINYPTVPVGEERVRITLTPQHTKEHVDLLVFAFHQLWQDLSLEKAA